MNIKRAKGRPKRQSGDAGRDKLVAAARVMLQNKSRIEINGKELATAAGVTPALVRYYFQTRSSLIEAVAQPMVDEYLAQLKSLLRSPDSIEDRFRALIRLLLRVSRENGHLIDSYVAYTKDNSNGSSAFLRTSFLELSAFIAECEEARFFKLSNSALTQTVIWGACKTVAQTEGLNALMADGPLSEGEIEDRQVALITDLFLSGLHDRAAGGA